MIFAILGIFVAAISYYVWFYVIIYHFSKVLVWVHAEIIEWAFLKAYDRIVIIPRC
jgi:hypothetical protein